MEAQTVLSPSHFIQLFRGDPKMFSGQPREIVPPACLGSSWGPLISGMSPEHLTKEASSNPNYMPEPPHLSSLGAEEQRFYSDHLPDGRASHPL